MRYFIASFFVLIFLNVNANINIRIKINPLECISCYSGNLAIEKFQPEIKISFIFHNMNQITINRFIERNFLDQVVESRKIEVINSDSLFDNMSQTPYSEICVYDDNEEMMRINFKDFCKRLVELKEFIKKDEQFFGLYSDFNLKENIQINSTTRFQMPQLISIGQSFFILDKVLNICVLFNSSGDSITSIDGLTFDPQILLAKDFEAIGPLVQQNDINRLKEIGYFTVQLDGVNVFGNNVYISLKVPLIVRKKNSDRFLVIKKSVIAEFSILDNRIIRYIYTDNTSESSELMTASLFVSGNNFLVPKVEIDTNKNARFFLTHYHLKGDSLFFLNKKELAYDFAKLGLPNSRTLKMKTDIGLIQSSNQFFGLFSDFTCFLPLESMQRTYPDITHEVVILDYFYNNGYLTVVFTNKEYNKFYTVYFNSKGDLYNINVLPILQGKLINVNVLDHHKIMIVDNNNNLQIFEN